MNIQVKFGCPATSPIELFRLFTVQRSPGNRIEQLPGRAPHRHSGGESEWPADKAHLKIMQP